MLPSMSAFKSLGIVIALAGGCATVVLAPSPVHAITGGEDAGPGERPDVEIITFDTLLSMSEAGLVIVRNNPRAYRLKHPILAESHLDTLANALIRSPNKTRRFLQDLKRARSAAQKQAVIERYLWKELSLASKTQRLIIVKGDELRKKGFLVNYHMRNVFGQKSSDPEVQDLYEMHDRYSAQSALIKLIQVVRRQLSKGD